MRSKGILYLVTLSLLSAMVSAGDSLGSAAKREQERREKKQDGKPVRTVTEEDLKAAREKAKAPRPTPSDGTGQPADAILQPLPIEPNPCCADDEDGVRHEPFARTYNGRSEAE